MRIEVFESSGNSVEFRCSLGTGAGVWRSDDPPLVGEICHVELDVDIEEAANVHLLSGGIAGIRLDGEQVVLGGLWHLTTDGAAYLEIGGTSVSVELSEDVGIPVESGEPVELTTARTAVHLFPYTL